MNKYQQDRAADQYQQDRTSTSEEIRTLTSAEVDAVGGGMLTQFTYGDTSIVIWANKDAHAVIVAKCSCE
jgi:hypothetical protein